MKTLRACAVAACMIAVLLTAFTGAAFADRPGPRFRPVDVFIDAGAQPLAAYQVEIIAADATIAGVEGGEHAAFHEPPYYDPEALRGGRIILAAFDTDGSFPHGRTRVATLHMLETGRPSYEIRLMAAGDPSGSRIAAEASVEPRNGDEEENSRDSDHDHFAGIRLRVSTGR